MPRYALKIEYDGRPFSGWQRQKDQPSVQGAVEAALGKLEANVPSIAAAGRTDAGVHALGQVATCDLQKDWTPFRLTEALNYHLKPDPVAIVDCALVDDGFHARFSAIERLYLFRLISRRAPLVHDRGNAWRVVQALDADAMQAGADSIKTSTGKEGVNATLPVSLTMVRALRDYGDATGHRVGFKPAGGMKSAKDALAWQYLMKEELGNDWLQPDLFRLGASSMLGDIERQLEHHVTGRYAAAHRHSLA